MKEAGVEIIESARNMRKYVHKYEMIHIYIGIYTYIHIYT